MPDPSGPRQSAIAAVLIIVAASSFFTAAADEKSASHVAAEFGGYPGGNAALVEAMNLFLYRSENMIEIGGKPRVQTIIEGLTSPTLQITWRDSKLGRSFLSWPLKLAAVFSLGI